MYLAFFRNVTSLFVVTVGSYFIPLATVPYLARVLGVEQFGILGVATGLVSYAILVSDWGFALSATQTVARNQQHPRALRRIFWSTVWAKTLLGVVATAALLALVAALPGLRGSMWIVTVMVTQVVGSILTTSWFLQGLERMVSLALSSFLIRLLTIPATFLFVHGPEDLVIAALIPGLAMIAVGVASLFLSARAIPLLPARPPSGAMFSTIREGTRLFITTGAISLYTQANVIAVGLVAGSAQAGLFHGVDRIKRAVQGLISPISSAAYPRINALVATDRARARQFMLWLLIGQGALTLVASIFLFVFAEPVIRLVLGTDYLPAVPTLKWIAALPFLIGLSNVFGINMLLPFGAKRTVSHATLGAGLVNMILIIPFSLAWGSAGAAASVVACEILVTVWMGVAAWGYLRAPPSSR